MVNGDIGILLAVQYTVVVLRNYVLLNEQNARSREQNAAGVRKIYERPDHPNEKHEM